MILIIVFGLILSVCFIIPGLFLYYKPPRDINKVIGYRTKRSMKNQDSWDFANKYSGKLMIIYGIIYLICVGVSVALFSVEKIGSIEITFEAIETIYLILLVLFFTLIIVTVEKQLKRK